MRHEKNFEKENNKKKFISKGSLIKYVEFCFFQKQNKEKFFNPLKLVLRELWFKY